MDGKVFSSTALVLLLAGCGMRTVTLSPAVYGSLTINGQPASGAEVFFGFSGNHDHPCPAVPMTRTNGEGEFHLPATTARLSTQKIKARRYTTTENYMCFRHGGKLVVGDLTLTELSETKVYTAECRLPVPPNAVAEDKLVCSWAHG